MAFPTIPTAGAGRVLTTTQGDTSGTRTFPSLSSLTKNSGDLLIAIIVAYQTSTGTNAAFSSWGGGFTEFHDSATSTTLAMGAAWKVSDGTETGTFTVTQAGTITGHAAMILLSIPGTRVTTAPEAGSRASGTTSAANPAAFDPAGWDAEDTLWIAVGGSGETSTTGSYTGLASAPANYGDYVDTGISADVVGGVEAAVAFRQINAASENVATFGLDTSNARNGAFVIAVRPALSASLGQASETDEAQPVTALQVAALDGVDSVSPSQLLLADPVYPEDVELVFGAAGQDVAVGQASETDLAQALTSAKVKQLGQASETDEAQAVTSGLTVAVLQVSETDLAQAVSSAKAKAIGQASETDLAQAVSGGLVVESLEGVDSVSPSQLLLADPVYPEDVELVFAAAGLVVGVGQALETDEAQAITSGLATVVSQATEADEAQALTSAKAKAIAQASETDSAQAIAAQQAGAQAELIVNLEAEDSNEAYEEPTQAGVIVAVSAPPADQTVGVNQASETDAAQALTSAKLKAIAQASESDAAQAITAGKAATLGQATETDTAQTVTVTGAKVIAIGQAQEADSAQGITWSPKIRVVGQATELDEAQSVSAGGVPLGQATEADSAQALVVAKRVVLGQATETDSAQGLGRAKVAHLLQAFESDSAQQILPAGAYAIGQASETDEAQPIIAVRVDYDWTPRGRIGGRRGRDRWERIGSSRAKGIR